MSSRLPNDEWAGEDLTGTAVPCQSHVILRCVACVYVRAAYLYICSAYPSKRMVLGLVFVGIRQKTRCTYTAYVNGYLWLFVSYYSDFFFFFLFNSQNRFGNAINGFRRGALVSEKSERTDDGRKKDRKKKLNKTKIVIRIQTDGR